MTHLGFDVGKPYTVGVLLLTMKTVRQLEKEKRSQQPTQSPDDAHNPRK